MAAIPFVKMHGAGNDFVVIDNREAGFSIDKKWAESVAHRRFGVGCDQLVVIEPSDKADVTMRIYNADGSEVEACGNASRCVAWRVMQESGKDVATLKTKAGVLECQLAGEHRVTIDMGEPSWEWDQIPLSERRNTLHLGIDSGKLMNPAAVSMGNPHMVFFVRDVDWVKLEEDGAKLESHPLFPEKANVSAAQVLDEGRIKLRVWERGSGETLACGTAACATVVAAVRREMTGREVEVELPGGTLHIHWHGNDSDTPNHVFMTGPVAVSFNGEIDEALVA